MAYGTVARHSRKDMVKQATQVTMVRKQERRGKQEARCQGPNIPSRECPSDLDLPLGPASSSFPYLSIDPRTEPSTLAFGERLRPTLWSNKRKAASSALKPVLQKTLGLWKSRNVIW